MINCEINITFSPDDYNAYADFYPGNGEGSELTMLFAKSVISEAGVKKGVNWDIVNSTIDYCNKSKKSKKDVKIATGTAPISEVPAHWNLLDKFFQHAMGFSDSILKVDYKEVSKFIMVKKGELLAINDTGREGVNGLSVKGKFIPFKKKKIVQFTNGKNTVEQEGRLYAATSGRYEVSDSRDIHINEVLHIEGNVDYSTGNISFGKDVIIEGEVKDGFKVAVGGSLLCKSNLDASDILCRKNLTVEKGIIGRGTALIRVGGYIESKFVENCHLESKSGVNIEKSIMNSDVFTLGHLNLADKGSIVSSNIYCELGVKVFNIGKLGSPNSEVSIGYSFIDKRSIDSIKQRLEVLEGKLKLLNKLPDYRKTDKKLELIKQITEVIERGRNELDNKLKNLYTHPDATVTVLGTVFPGNIIKISGTKYTITEEKHKVKFYLNEESGRVEHVPL